MASVRKICIFFDGTYSTIEEENVGFLSSVGNYFMSYKKSNLTQLFQNCKEPLKFYFKGPGTDICNSNIQSSIFLKLAGTLLGGIDGHLGLNSIENTLSDTLKIIIDQGKQAKSENKKLEIYVYSWSRGGFTAWRLKKSLTNLIDIYKLEISDIYFFNIDPVPGGLPDRIRLYWYSSIKDPNVNTHVINYFSNTGNLQIWESFLGKFLTDIPNLRNFSALVFENSPNIKTNVNLILDCNHESIAGRDEHLPVSPNNEEKKKHGRKVLGDILTHCPNVEFDEKWKENKLAQAEESITQEKSPECTRKFLSPESLRLCLIGTNKTEVTPKLTNKLETPKYSKKN